MNTTSGLLLNSSFELYVEYNESVELNKPSDSDGIFSLFLLPFEFNSFVMNSSSELTLLLEISITLVILLFVELFLSFKDCCGYERKIKRKERMNILFHYMTHKKLFFFLFY